MFSGIVSAVGTVIEVRPGRLGIAEAQTATHLQPGASIAVNGCCLTATEIEAGTFFADVVPETLRRTNLGNLQSGSPVNLELPVRLDQALGGHMVLGHVDSTARILETRPAQQGMEVSIELPESLAAYVAEKGSIAVDGVSLTVAAVSAGRFAVALIPHTLASTIARNYAAATLVNLEADVVARYVHRLLETGKGIDR